MSERVMVRREGGRLRIGTRGEPLFLLMDTAWSGLIRSTLGDWRDYLGMRKVQGFNAVLTIVTAPWRGAATDEHGESAVTADGRVNGNYFERMKEKFAAAEAEGMVLLPVLIWACTANDPGQVWAEERCVDVAREAVGRLERFKNVIWLLGGDGKYERDAQRWVRIGRAVFGGKPEALVGMHHGGLTLPDDALAAESWCKFHGVQSGHGDGDNDFVWLQETLPAWRNRAPHLAVANAEPNYEHHPAYRSQMMFTGRHVRRAAWWSVLRMASCGVGYGHNSVWNWNTVPEGAVGHEWVTSVVGKLPPWRDAIDLPGARSMGVLRQFLEARDWAKIKPSQKLVGVQSHMREQFVAAAQIGEEGIFYKPAGAAVVLSDSAMSRYTHMQWFDPLRGVYGEEQRVQREPAVDSILRDDWVLVLRR